MAKGIKSLKDVAGVYKVAVSDAIQSGPTRAWKTGNLFRSFNTDGRNSAEKIGFQENDTFIFRVVIGPQNAEYGSYVHSGTKYMKGRPYAEAGAKSPEFKFALDEFMNGKVGEKLDTEFLKISKDFKKAGFQIT
tara:strand:+ start:741 stop:1142 length:402 start_codon:yes stop_codon:yes gene_type:complete